MIDKQLWVRWPHAGTIKIHQIITNLTAHTTPATKQLNKFKNSNPFPIASKQSADVGYGSVIGQF